jgi:hypothetical protein
MILTNIFRNVLVGVNINYVSNFQLIQNRVENPPSIFGSTDILIYQPLKNHGKLDTDYIIGNILPKQAKTISFPYIYFLGYFPDFLQVKFVDMDEVKRWPDKEDHLPYQYKRVNQLIDNGTSYHNFFMDITQQKDFITLEETIDRLQFSLNKLKEKEMYCDVKLYDFVISKYKQCRLFHSPNHPTNVIFTYLANSIMHFLCKILQLDCKIVFDFSSTEEFLGVHSNMLIFPCIHQHLALEFPIQQNCYLQGSNLSLDEYWTKYIRLYKSSCTESAKAT